MTMILVEKNKHSLLLYHCVKGISIRIYFGPHISFSERYYLFVFIPNKDPVRIQYSDRIQSECGKMRTSITPNTETFSQYNILIRLGNQKLHRDDVCIIRSIREYKLARKKKVCSNTKMVSQERKLIYKKKILKRHLKS